MTSKRPSAIRESLRNLAEWDIIKSPDSADGKVARRALEYCYRAGFEDAREKAASECDKNEELSARARALCDPVDASPVSMWDRYDDVVKMSRLLADAIRNIKLKETDDG